MTVSDTPPFQCFLDAHREAIGCSQEAARRSRHEGLTTLRQEMIA
jgi:hypothetical protein